MNNDYIQYESLNGISFYHFTTDNHKHENIKNKNEKKNSYYEILLLMRGKLVFELDGSKYEILPNDVLLLNIHNLPSLKISSADTYEGLILRFSPHLIPKLTNIDILESFMVAHSFRHIIPNEIITKSNVKKLLFSIEEYCRENEAYTDLQILSILLELLKELDDITKFSNKKNIATKTSVVSVNSFSKLCIEYINDNLSQKLTTKKIADYLHLSPSYLHHCFLNEFGVSIHQYILNQKMQLASLMLNSGRTPHQISKDLGYEYYSTFLKNFHKFFGYNPTEYNLFPRKSNKN